MIGCFGHNCRYAGQEFPLLAAAFPEHDIVGIDLAQGMVDLAEQVIKEKGLRCDCGDMLLWGWRGVSGHRVSLVRGPRLVGGSSGETPGPLRLTFNPISSLRARRVSVECGDATSLLPITRGRPVAGIFSGFGLQQIPRPAQALRDWAGVLAPGGALVVAYWPHIVEERGPWRCLTDLTVGSENWQGGIPDVALAALPGLELVSDTEPAFEMVWPGAAEFFEVHSYFVGYLFVCSYFPDYQSESSCLEQRGLHGHA